MAAHDEVLLAYYGGLYRRAEGMAQRHPDHDMYGQALAR